MHLFRSLVIQTNVFWKKCSKIGWNSARNRISGWFFQMLEEHLHPTCQSLKGTVLSPSPNCHYVVERWTHLPVSSRAAVVSTINIHASCGKWPAKTAAIIKFGRNFILVLPGNGQNSMAQTHLQNFTFQDKGKGGSCMCTVLDWSPIFIQKANGVFLAKQL